MSDTDEVAKLIESGVPFDDFTKRVVAIKRVEGTFVDALEEAEYKAKHRTLGAEHNFLWTDYVNKSVEEVRSKQWRTRYGF